MDKKARIKELIEILSQANKAYYQDAKEIMTNFDYDRLYDELKQLEQETGVVMANSPTIHVGYEVVSQLPKEQHESPMLSLDKTKEVGTLAEFAGDRNCLLSWKLDGLTVVLTYEKGSLAKAVTRGNGQVGEVITNNARTFQNLPLNIPYQGRLTLRGEAIIKYSDFHKINKEIGEAEAKYKNPRNLCSGSVRQLNSEVTAARNVNFIAFALIHADDVDFDNSMENQYRWLEEQGFEVVERKIVTESNMEEVVSYFAEKVKTYDYPSDGLVLMYDDIAYGLSLGSTAKFPRNGIAFKWKDEEAETVLDYIEWSPSRTGLINPVAVFRPVELEGTTVTRASVHNISIMEELKLGVGDTIKVYKANMIIPQISENLTKSGFTDIPDSCPACGKSTEVRNENGVKTLYCPNRQCPAKHVKLYTLFVSRNAMNIDGLSEETLEKFIDAGYIHEFADIFKLDRYEEEIVNTPGFGRKSYDNLMDSVNRARQVELHALIYSLGIPNIGTANAKLICKHFQNDFDKIRNAAREELVEINHIGDKMAEKFADYFADEENNAKVDRLLEQVTIKKSEENNIQNMEGLTFVVTGSVEKFANRNAVKEYIEKRGGKVTGSVTSKTNYLINNDVLSNSSKNRKAKELGIEIISEEQFLEKWQ